MKQISKGKQILLFATICMTSIAIMSEMAFIPVADAIFTTYASAGEAVLNFILSGATLISAFATLLAGSIVSKVGNKKILVTSFLICTVSSLLLFVVDSSFGIAFLRGVCGIGIGGLNVVNIDIISAAYEDENQRGAMIGLYTGAQGVIAAVLAAVAGMVGSGNWRNIFHLFWICLPILALTIIAVPADVLSGTTDSSGGSGKESFPWSSVLPMVLAYFAFSLFYSVIYYEVAIVLAEKGLGNSSTAGILSSIGTIGGCIGAVSFGKVYASLKRVSMVISYLGMAAVYMLLFISHSTLLAGVCCFLLGVFFTMGMSYYLTTCTVIVPEAQIGVSVSITTFMGVIGCSLSTYACTILQQVLHSDTLTGIIPIVAGLLALGGILSAVFAFRKRN